MNRRIDPDRTSGSGSFALRCVAIDYIHGNAVTQSNKSIVGAGGGAGGSGGVREVATPIEG